MALLRAVGHPFAATVPAAVVPATDELAILSMASSCFYTALLMQWLQLDLFRSGL